VPAGHVRVVRNPAAAVYVFRLEQRIKQSVAEAIARDARRLAPVATGALRDHIEVQGGRAGRVKVVATGGGDPLNPMVPVYVEFGTGPHWIISGGYAKGMRNPYPLRNRETGQVFGPVVWHPGTPAQPFLRPAAYRKRVLAMGGRVAG
jgi:hypothetical protein